MEYQYKPFDSKVFATNLKLKNDGKLLKWDTSTGASTLVVCGPFEEDVLPLIPAICQKLESIELSLDNDFLSLSPELPQFSVRLLDAQRKAREGGCRVKGEVCRYTILACKAAGGTVSLFAPKKKQTVDVPAEITIVCKKVYDFIKGGLFSRDREVFAGFYEVGIANKNLNAYQDGDICYLVNDIQIPLTEEALDAGVFYVKTQTLPSFHSRNNGYRITIREED